MSRLCLMVITFGHIDWHLNHGRCEEDRPGDAVNSEIVGRRPIMKAAAVRQYHYYHIISRRVYPEPIVWSCHKGSSREKVKRSSKGSDNLDPGRYAVESFTAILVY